MTSLTHTITGRSGEHVLHRLLLLILFLLPAGSFWILSEAHAVVAGRYNPFAVPKIYAVEILILLAAAVWMELRRPKWRELLPYRWLLIVIGIAAASYFWAPDELLAAVSAGHVAVSFLLLFMLAREFRNRHFMTKAVWVLTAGVAVQAAWGITQFGLQHDLGLRYLGESILGPGVENVAKVAHDGTKEIRAYGSLPHPNILAAYLAAALFWIGAMVFWPFKGRPAVHHVISAGLLVLLGTALVLTFSRVALVMTVVNGALVALYSIRKWHRLPVGAAIGAVAFIIVIGLFWPQVAGRTQVETASETGISNRVAGLELAQSMIEDRPAGVGAGNFVLAINEINDDLPPYQHEPVHNTILLIASELGAIAAALMAAFLIRVGWLFHRLAPRDRQTATLNFSLFALAGVLLVMSFFDHFFWSLPQGQWLAAVVAAALISRIPANRLAEL